MAAAVLLSNVVLCNTPWLIRKVKVTAGTDGLAITHGEATAPDLIIFNNATTNPTASETSAVRTSATVITVDCEAAAGTVEMILVWFPLSAGGIS